MTLRVVLDYIIDEVSRLGFYTHTILGYVVAGLDSFATVVSVLLYSIYIILSHREDPNARKNLASFFAGYLAHEVKAAVLPA